MTNKCPAKLGPSDGRAGWMDDQWHRLSPSSTPSSPSSDSLLSPHESRPPSPSRTQLPSWKLLWPFAQRPKKADKNDDHEDGTAFGLQSIISQHRLHRRPPPINIPLIPNHSSPTASPLSPSWWTTASTPLMETSPKQGSVCSTTSPPRCLCHHRSSQKEVCLCGGTGRAETTPKTMIRSHARPCFSSSPSPPHEPTTTHPWTPRASAENHDRPGLDNPCLISSNMSPSLERRRPSAGDVTRKKSPSPLQDESTASSPKEHISNHRRLVHQKHQYNQYLLGHPDCFDFHLATNDFEQGGDESFRQKTTMDKSIRDKKKAMLGGGRRGVHAFQRQRRRRWRVVQRWSIIISLVVVLAAGTALIMHFVAQRPWTSAPAAPLESVVEEVGGGVAPHIQHVTAPSSNPRDILEPSATDILLRQEQVYAQDPQQERVDRLLYRGGGDRWIVHRSALVAEQVLRLQQLQRQQEQERQNARSLLLESDEADPDGIRVRQQPGTANLLDFHPDDDDDD